MESVVSPDGGWHSSNSPKSDPTAPAVTSSGSGGEAGGDGLAWSAPTVGPWSRRSATDGSGAGYFSVTEAHGEVPGAARKSPRS